MWRIVQGFPRVLRSQWGSTRPTPAVCHGEEGGEQCPLPGLSWCQEVPQHDPGFYRLTYFHTRCDSRDGAGSGSSYADRCGASRRPGCGWQRSVRGETSQQPGSNQHKTSQCHCHGDGHHGNNKDSENRDWSEWFGSVKFGRHADGMLEAVGWGTVLILGAELTHLWQLTPRQRYDVMIPQKERSWAYHLYRLAFSEETDPIRKQILPNTKHTETTQSREQAHDHTSQSHDHRSQSGDHISRSGDQKSQSFGTSLHHPSGEALWSELSHDLSWDPNEQEFLSRLGRAETEQVLANDLSGSLNGEDSHSECLSFDEKEFSDKWSPETGYSRAPFPEVVQEWERLQAVYQGAAHNMAGYQAVKEGRETDAIAAWREASEVGYPKAQYNLGLSFHLGTTGDKNMNKAIELYRQAAEQGHDRALYNLGVLYLEGSRGEDGGGEGSGGQGGRMTDPGDMENIGRRLLEQAASLGLKQAQTELGVLYTEESYKNMDKAAELFKMASEQDEVRGAYYLGICYENGWGVDRDHRQAAELYQKSCDLGHKEACHNLAVFYEKGLGGLPKDEDTASMYYTKSEQSGAGENVERLHRSATDSDVSRSKSEGVTEQSSTNHKGLSSTNHMGSSASSPSLIGHLQQCLVDHGFGEFDLSQTADAGSHKSETKLYTASSPGRQTGIEKSQGEFANNTGRQGMVDKSQPASDLEIKRHTRSSDIKLGSTKVSFNLGESDDTGNQSDLDWSLGIDITNLQSDDCQGTSLQSYPLRGSFGSIPVRNLRQSSSAATNLQSYTAKRQFGDISSRKLNHTSSAGELRRAACQ